MEEVKPNLPESRYAPLNLEEFQLLKGILDSITSHIPEQHAPLIWSSFNRVRGVDENRPCTCASSAGHWGRAVRELREWIKSKS
jgi:hypothetical protein